ncbi:hypothetical protein [Coprococcus sp. AM100_B19A]|nr:hypothetical protein [Coprococcus sp. AM100_B19A]
MALHETADLLIYRPILETDWNYHEGSLNPRIGIFTIVQLLIEMIANKAL